MAQVESTTEITHSLTTDRKEESADFRRHLQVTTGGLRTIPGSIDDAITAASEVRAIFDDETPVIAATRRTVAMLYANKDGVDATLEFRVPGVNTVGVLRLDLTGSPGRRAQVVGLESAIRDSIFDDDTDDSPVRNQTVLWQDGDRMTTRVDEGALPNHLDLLFNEGGVKLGAEVEELARALLRGGLDVIATKYAIGITLQDKHISPPEEVFVAL